MWSMWPHEELPCCKVSVPSVADVIPAVVATKAVAAASGERGSGWFRMLLLQICWKVWKGLWLDYVGLMYLIIFYPFLSQFLKFFKVPLRSAHKLRNWTYIAPQSLNKLDSVLNPASRKKQCLLCQSGNIQLLDTLKNSYQSKRLGSLRNQCVCNMYISDVEYLASGCHPGFHQEFSSLPSSDSSPGRRLPGGPFHPCPCRDHHAGRPDDRSPFDRRGDHRGGHRGARNGGRPGDRRGGRRSHHHHHHLPRQRWQRLWKDGEVLNPCL